MTDPKFDDPVEERKFQQNKRLRSASRPRFVGKKKKRKKRDYNMVKKRHPSSGNMRLLAMKGTVESRDIPIDPTPRIAETQKETRQFLSRREKPMYSPVIISTKVEPHLISNLKSMGVSFKINRDNIPSSMLITMNKRRVDIIDLNHLGIVVDRPTKNHVAISSYDLLYLLERGYLSTDEAQSKQAHKETFEFFSRQDPNYLEKYMVYQMCKYHGYTVMDGIRYGFDFIIYEEPSNEFIYQLNNLDPSMIGPGKAISGYGMGAVDVVLRGKDEIEVQEVIKGQHLSNRNDMRYFLADVKGDRDSEGHLIRPTGEVNMHGIRLNKLNLNKFNTPGKDAIILDRTDD